MTDTEKAIAEPLPGRYRHYKGQEYEVIALAKHTETLEEMVVYKALYDDGKVWVRPRGHFLETVLVDGQAVQRFARVG